MSHPSDFLDPAELELERELRQMFELDSQKDLETYLTSVESLQDRSWKSDIQQMYRAVHTIKGGSVTVKADAVLKVATVLEDLLSELRYLETIPSLADGQLQEMLLEGGEIVASVFNNQEDDVHAQVERIQILQQQIQQSYLQDWNEQAQVQIEFAEQGFEMVVLELEIALNALSPSDRVSETLVAQATQLIEDLLEIGRELALESGWEMLLQEATELLDTPDASTWKTQWHEYFRALKASAKQGGKLMGEQLGAEEATEDIGLGEIGSLLSSMKEQEEADQDHAEDLLNLGEIDSLLVQMADTSEDEPESVLEAASSLEDIDLLLSNIEESEPEQTSTPDSSTDDLLDLEAVDSLLDSMEGEGEHNGEIDAAAEPKSQPATPLAVSPNATKAIKSTEDIQIPIPLSRLDKSANSIIDTLIASRTTKSFYENLHQDLIKLVNLAKDNVQYITQLRQIQDDYALLENLESLDRQAVNNDHPTPERYRQGYTTINRLLENSLRLAELGKEVEQTANQTADKLQVLNDRVTSLKDVVEDSRLVPFKNLAFRVKAILRDLANRYHKPVQLTVQGEQIELDVGTAKRLEPILLHLVRNAFDHGLETSEKRIAAKKPEQGKIVLDLQRYGSSYVLSLQDDGKGIDPEQIRAKAITLKFPWSDTSTLEQLLSVICQPGFSSKGQVSDVSGRGVGMDVVAEQISKLNGFLGLETVIGQGTTFTIHFPVPHLLVPCLLMQAGEYSFAVPTDRVIMTDLWENLTVEKTALPHVKYTWEVTQNEITAAVPGCDLLAHWYPRFKDRKLSSSSIGICVQPQSNRSPMWLLADNLLGQLELKIQPLPQPLTAPPGIMGVSLQADSSLLPVLELTSLSEYLLPTAAHTTDFVAPLDQKINSQDPSSQDTFAEQSQTILIVDDAALIRRRLEASLTAYGYTTHACADGLEAWNWLLVNPQPALIITDIEMPNLDGFGLIDRCRKKDWRFPIIVISSRLAEEWGQEARRLGGTDFLTKGFSTGELIAKVREYYQI